MNVSSITNSVKEHPLIAAAVVVAVIAVVGPIIYQKVVSE